MTGMDDLVTFLRAQLDDDEQVARACDHADPAPWVAYGDSVDAGVATESGGVIRDGDGNMRRDVAEHIARWDPAHVLAEVDAKRWILDVILQYEAKIDGEWACCHSAVDIGAGLCPETNVNEITALRLLALPYVDKPGYREEWRP